MSRRGGVAVAILLAWVAGLGLLARRELFRPAADRLADAAMRVTPGASFYAVDQGGAQIGFWSSTIDTLPLTDSTPAAIEVTDYLVADLPIGGKLQRASAQSRVRLTRGLRLTDFEVGITSEQGPIRVTGHPEGDTVLVFAVKTGDEPADTQRVAVRGPVLMPTLVPLTVALGEPPKVGKRYTLSVFSPLALGPQDVTLAVRAESLFVLTDSAAFDSTTRRWRPAHTDSVRAWLIAAENGNASGAGFSGWVDEQGRIVQASQLAALNLTMRRTAYELAFENWRLAQRDSATRTVTEDRDILESTAIAASAPLRGRGARRLSVRLENVDLVGYDLEGGRQRLAGRVLSVGMEPDSLLRATYVLPGDAAHKARFRAELAAEPLAQSGHPEIAFLAMRIAGADKDPRVVAQKINRWVHDSLKKVITFGVPNALQVLHARQGDCNEHTQLFAAIARAIGIPTRTAAGLVYLRGKFYYHAWPEVYLNGWVAVDPTLGQFPADAAHLRFVLGGLQRQAELLRLIGNLKIDVVDER